MIAIAIGVALIVCAIVVQHRAQNRLLDRWKHDAPREWSNVAHQMRRRFPFNVLVRARILHFAMQMWWISPPDWLREDLVAQKHFASVRRSGWIFFAGVVVIGCHFMP